MPSSCKSIDPHLQEEPHYFIEIIHLDLNLNYRVLFHYIFVIFRRLLRDEAKKGLMNVFQLLFVA